MAKVTVRWFAMLRERRGTDTEIVSIEEGATAEAVYARLCPDEASGGLKVGYAVNEAMVPGGTALSDGDEVVFLPPVGGG